MPKDLKWLCSYETYKFDTLDGALHLGEYAIFPPGDRFIIVNPVQPTEIVCGQNDYLVVSELDVTGLTEVHIDGRRAFDVFEDPDTKERQKTAVSLETYHDLAKPGAGPRTKIKE